MNFKVSETSFLRSYSVPIHDLNLLMWVRDEAEVEKFYLKLRDDHWEWAGSGNLFTGRNMTLEDAMKLIQDSGGEDVKVFLAHTFDLNPESARFILPRFEVSKKNDQLVFKVNFWKDEIVNENFLDRERFKKISQTILPSPKNKSTTRIDKPDREGWAPYFNKAQLFLESYSKVVLARITEATFESPIDPFALLESLKQESYRCYLRTPNGEEVVSVSPERLFKIEGRRLTTEAVAGTKPLSADHRELLDSPKERAEHRYVVDEILQQLAPFTTKISPIGSPFVAAFKKVLHLKTPISAQLKDHFSISALIRALHPTPAVGGLPKTEALDWLETHEPFKRGYYAAPFGVVGNNFAEFFVNIRSVLIEDKSLKLYSGVGIVKDSVALSEWNELDLKASQFWEALS